MEITQDIYFDVAKHAKAWGTTNVEASKIIQKELFKAGKEWYRGGHSIKYVDESYLFAYASAEDIKYSSTLPFYGCPQAEATLQASTTYTLHIVEKATPEPEEEDNEIIQLMGKKYSKADIEKALALLQPKEEV